MPIMGTEIRIPIQDIEAAREQARKNHNQSLEKLAERGGLSPSEFYRAYFGYPNFWDKGPTDNFALDWIKDRFAEERIS